MAKLTETKRDIRYTLELSETEAADLCDALAFVTVGGSWDIFNILSEGLGRIGQ